VAPLGRRRALLGLAARVIMKNGKVHKDATGH